MADQDVQHDDTDDIAALRDRIHGIRFAMVTIADSDGRLRGRPLTVQDTEFDGTLWFLVSRTADWTAGLATDTRANAALSDDSDQRWVSIAGTVALVEDRERIDAMWSPLYAAWFSGPDDPDAVLLRFDSEIADYWDAEANRVVQLARLLKRAVTGSGDEGARGTLTA